MKRLYILLVFFFALIMAGEGYAQRSRHNRHRNVHRTHRTYQKKKRGRYVHRRPARHRRKTWVKPDPTLSDPFYTPLMQCEDTCDHVHGIDMSHYQSQVFWETIGENTKMAYVYLKATEGREHIDATYERNIQMAHDNGLLVGSYHFFRPRIPLDQQLNNFMAQCLPEEQDLIPMIDIETTGGMPIDDFCDSLLIFINMVDEAYGQKPLLYTYRNFYNKYLIGKISDEYKMMIAMYMPEEPVLADGRDITMWQYTGTGRIVGVAGYVDKSRFLGNHSLREIKYEH